MGFWTTGYEEFHEPMGLDSFVWEPSPPARYACDICRQDFASQQALQQHRFEAHPRRQPLLMVRGRAVGQSALQVLSPLQADDIVVEDAQRATINGKKISIAGLRKRLLSAQHEYMQISLENAGVVTQCHLDFQIASTDHLQGVEAAFLRMAQSRKLGPDALERFIKECAAFDTARSYYDGICQYLYGVMAKERTPGCSLAPDKFKEKYGRARDVLNGVDRPLARNILALVAFQFNHFADADWLASEGPLQEAAGTFSGLLSGFPWHFEQAFKPRSGRFMEDLLTDENTLQILRDVSLGLAELKRRTSELQECLKRTPPGFDQLKRAVLTAEALAASQNSNNHAEARRIARVWAGRSDTQAWAEALLTRLNPT